MANILSALVSRGPLSIALNGNLNSFILYKSGVYSDINCSSLDLNHAGKN
jgi:hypothetical protein